MYKDLWVKFLLASQNPVTFKRWLGFWLTFSIWKSFMVGERKGTSVFEIGFQLIAYKSNHQKEDLIKRELKLRRNCPLDKIQNLWLPTVQEIWNEDFSFTFTLDS